jgi:hypothetical protein
VTDESQEGGFSLKLPFWIDTDAYSERDQHFFCFGFEYAVICRHIEYDDSPLSTVIHRENESRVRMACGRLGRRCKIEACEPKDDPAGTWSYLEIEAR